METNKQIEVYNRIISEWEGDLAKEDNIAKWSYAEGYIDSLIDYDEISLIDELVIKEMLFKVIIQ